MRSLLRSSLLVCCVLLAVGCAPEEDAGDDDDDDGASPTPVPIPTADLLTPSAGNRFLVIGDPGSAKGIFDASFAVPAPGTLGVMTYSSVTAIQEVFTRVGVTTNGGMSWHYLRDVNGIEPTTISDAGLTVCGAAMCDGNILHETSSLVLDSTDPDPDREFKVFLHTYFFDGDIHYAHGWMSMYTADEPHLAWTETKIFGWDAAPPTSTTGVNQNINDIPGLEDCILLSEPGAAVFDGDLYMSTGCVQSDAAIRIELLRSTDHGDTWTRAGTLIDDVDAAALGALNSRVNASSLFNDGSTLWLSVTPTSSDWDYDGCWIIEVDDPAAGAVMRDTTGRPLVHRFIDAADSRFNGMCVTDVGLDEWIVGALDVTATDPFRIYRSGIATP